MDVAISFGIGCLGIVLGIWGPSGTALKAELIAVAGTTASIIGMDVDSSKQEDVVIPVQSLKRANRKAQQALGQPKQIKTFSSELRPA